MTTLSRMSRMLRDALMIALAVISASACSEGAKAMNQSELIDFATRYAAAWSSQDSEKLASFYAEDGTLRVNGGDPAVGRAAIAAKASGFMEAFPDMVVKVESVRREGDRVVFNWIWTGTNTGPGGTGHSVRMTGHEAWTMSADGQIAASDGHYDEAEYERQVSGRGGGG
jgi:steroid delta-isomerase-like uncharacterized protein